MLENFRHRANRRLARIIMAVINRLPRESRQHIVFDLELANQSYALVCVEAADVLRHASDAYELELSEEEADLIAQSVAGLEWSNEMDSVYYHIDHYLAEFGHLGERAA